MKFSSLQEKININISVKKARRSATAKQKLEEGLKHVVLDMEREERCGFPEFIYGEGKTYAQLEAIANKMLEAGKNLCITRLPAKFAKKLLKLYPNANWEPICRVFIVERKPIPKCGTVFIAVAGTTDLPVAMEAKLVAEFCGCGTKLATDIGVAGLHRMLARLDEMRQADVIIAIAGMEGALPSVIGGLVKCPVIAVPTSIGYGTSMKGLTALLAMMNSCASGITVVNIDNGFGAGCAAARIINNGRTTNV
ncbi:MAG: nickel pincer cofactor biosynthesis protein LarB [Candidatus Nanoarchaeia archaeon]